MQIQTGHTRLSGLRTSLKPPGDDGQPPKKEQEIAPGREDAADRFNGSRSFGNYTSGVVLGATKELVTTTAQSPLLAWEIAENLWQAETIGPNLKTLGTLAAIPLAALSIPAGPFYGAYQGVKAVHSGHGLEDSRPLTKDTSNDFARSVFPSNAPEEASPRTMTGSLIESLEELGDRKLEPGQKPFDVPILSPLFAVTGGVVSGAMSGAVGLVAGLVAGGITSVKEAKRAFTEPDQSIGERVLHFVASPLPTFVMPVALAWSGIKESVPRGLADGWRHGVIKPIVDTAQVSAKLAVGVVKEAWER